MSLTSPMYPRSTIVSIDCINKLERDKLWLDIQECCNKMNTDLQFKFIDCKELLMELELKSSDMNSENSTKYAPVYPETYIFKRLAAMMETFKDDLMDWIDDEKSIIVLLNYTPMIIAEILATNAFALNACPTNKAVTIISQFFRTLPQPDLGILIKQEAETLKKYIRSLHNVTDDDKTFNEFASYTFLLHKKINEIYDYTCSDTMIVSTNSMAIPQNIVVQMMINHMSTDFQPIKIY